MKEEQSGELQVVAERDTRSCFLLFVSLSSFSLFGSLDSRCFLLSSLFVRLGQVLARIAAVEPVKERKRGKGGNERQRWESTAATREPILNPPFVGPPSAGNQ